nr:hypothetical protein [Stenotrophomonas maltophilia]
MCYSAQIEAAYQKLVRMTGHVRAWLDPARADLAALCQIFDDKRHPFYEHKLAA